MTLMLVDYFRAVFQQIAICSLAPLLRGEGWGEGLLSAILKTR
jgi:hypothetical protein